VVEEDRITILIVIGQETKEPKKPKNQRTQETKETNHKPWTVVLGS
jgi:hypothetical protein